MLKFIPGFKTGKKWKSIMAVLFYLTLFVVLLNPIGVTIRDKIIFIFNYLILAGTPFVLLLNFGSIRSKLPLFKSKSIKGTILGVISTLILITVVVASTSALKSPEQKRLDYIASQQAEEEQRIKANDEKFAKNIDEKITALGRIKNISLFQSDEISKLFQDYEALTSNQKKFIKEYDTLVAAQKKIHDLESEKIAAEKTAAAEAAAAEEAAEKAAAEEAAAEEAAAEEAAAEEAAAEKAAAEKAAAEEEAAEKAAAEEAAAEKAAAEKAAAEKAAAEEAAAEEAAAEEKPNLFSKVMKDDGLIDDLVKSLKAIGISPEKVKNLKQLDDWVGGSRYSFVYDGMELLVYSRTDSTVESIRYGLDTDIYKKGYEPYNISDFYFDDSLYSTLTMKAENKVKSKLNYPATAKFSRTGWGRSRNHDLYSVSSSVTAKNAFGVEEVLPFLLTYQVVDDKAKLVYFELGNEVITDNLEAVRLTERKKLAALQKPVGSTEERITIVEGQIGKYGKEVTINGYESIQYRIPEGKYTVTNQVNYCKVFIAKNKLITNSDGVKERRIIDTIELTSNGQTEEITIKSDEHLFVTAYSTISLEKSN